MGKEVEQAKAVIGYPYTASKAKELQGIVGSQRIEVLGSGNIRYVESNVTYVVTDSSETVIAIFIGR